MADGQPAPARPVVVVAMKGHPGSGKSTAARAIAAALRCPLLDKDDVRDCTLHLEGVVAAGVLNDLSYAVLWRMAERQVWLGLSVVIDSPLSRRAHLDALTRLPGALVVVVECRPGDTEEWRRRLEDRGVAIANGGGGGGDGCHKPKTWAELERLVEGYQGCTDYEIGDVPRIVVDTTDPAVDVQAIAEKGIRIQELEGSTTSSVFVFYQFSVQDGVSWPKTRGACYFAGAGAILRDVQARSVPSSHRKSAVIRCGLCNCCHSRRQRELEGRHPTSEGHQFPHEFSVPVHWRTSDP